MSGMVWCPKEATVLRVLLLVAMGCEDAPEPAVSACELLAQQRRACDASVETCRSEFEVCEADCVLGLACAELLEPMQEPGASACIQRCEPKFTCANGDNIPKRWTCDDKLDCAGGEDEQGCRQ
jgi:hypothetical protein